MATALSTPAGCAGRGSQAGAAQVSRTPGWAGLGCAVLGPSKPWLGGQWVPTLGAGWSRSHRRCVILSSQFLETSPYSFISLEFLALICKVKGCRRWPDARLRNPSRHKENRHGVVTRLSGCDFLKPAAGHVGFADISDAFCFVSFTE